MIKSWKIPDKTIYTQNPKRFLEENTIIYSKAYGLLEYGYKLLFESALKAYEKAGVFGNAIAPITKEEVIERSKNITTEDILNIAMESDEVNGAFLKDKLSDEEPLKAYLGQLDKIRTEVERAGDKDAAFKILTCPDCKERLMLFSESLNSLECGIQKGALLLTKQCPKCGHRSSLLFGEDEKGVIKGVIKAD